MTSNLAESIFTILEVRIIKRMEIKEFIEKAIEGGWDKVMLDGDSITKVDLESLWVTRRWGEIKYCAVDTVLLDPKAWQAVGKVEGWGKLFCKICKGEVKLKDHAFRCKCKNPQDNNKHLYKDIWQDRMKQMIPALIKGKTLEEFIKTL